MHILADASTAGKSDATTPSPAALAAAPWVNAAEALAAWALPRYFARTDRYGGYRLREGAVGGTTYPGEGPRPGAVNLELLCGHFRATGTAQVVGAHTLNPETDCGLWAAVDIDAHADESGEVLADPDANRRFAEVVARGLAGHGFRPLCYESNGLGGYHVVAFVAEPVPGTALAGLGRYAARGWRDHLTVAPETYPKQTKTGANGFGNWLRLVGRHHTLPHWPRVFDPASGEWLGGADAVRHVLTLTGEDAGLIPFDALASGASGAGEDADPTGGSPRPDPTTGGQNLKPGEAFNAVATGEDLVALLVSAGWSVAARRGDVFQVTRPGKTHGCSATVGHCQGRSPGPRLYVYTTNAPPFEPGQLYTPFAVRAHLRHGGDYKACAQELAAQGFGKGPATGSRDILGGGGVPATTTIVATAMAKRGPAGITVRAVGRKPRGGS